MTQLCIATNNRGKQREFAELLGWWPGELVYPQDLGLEVEVEEVGTSFEEIARHKAQVYARASNLTTMADDSGLEVDALGGGPGIYSARYAGPNATDADRYRKLLRALAGRPDSQRTARFRCSIALAYPDGDVAVAEGTCEGVIAHEPRGEHGFGYDPVFYLPQYGCTMAELPPEIKNRISHRARAIQAAKALLDVLL